MIVRMKTPKVIEDLKVIFYFSNLDENHEFFNNINKKVISENKIEKPEKVIIDESIGLRSKVYAFKCGHKSKNKLEGISKSSSKKSKLEEY